MVKELCEGRRLLMARPAGDLRIEDVSASRKQEQHSALTQSLSQNPFMEGEVLPGRQADVFYAVREVDEKVIGVWEERKPN